MAFPVSTRCRRWRSCRAVDMTIKTNSPPARPSDTLVLREQASA